MKIILLGPPGSGKGTIAAWLSEHFEIPTISTGAMIRNEIRNGTELGKKAENCINKGQLLSDDIILDMMKERLGKSDCMNGFVLDGFPRTLAQAQALSDMDILGEYKAVKMAVNDDVIIKRLSGRRECPNCGATYHLTNLPPKTEGMCDKCSGKLIVRDDDKEDVIINRLSVYHKQTEPLIGFYDDKNVLVTARADVPIDESIQSVLEVLGVAK